MRKKTRKFEKFRKISRKQNGKPTKNRENSKKL